MMTLSEVKDVLRKRKLQIKNNPKLKEAYSDVLIDLIEATDSCTGELI